MDRIDLDPGIILLQGDCLEVMRDLDENSIDAIVTDPPYGIRFMSKNWDHGIPGSIFWSEILRIAKPGAHLLAFGGTRTFHRLTCAIEDAGWEIRDCVMWVYGSGFPKSLDISKAIDKVMGNKREIIGTAKGVGSSNTKSLVFNKEYLYTIPATKLSRQWSGFGTALKPSYEPIIMARKPLIGTVAENVMRYGTGGINIEGCKIGTEQRIYNGSGSQCNKLYNHDKGDTGIGYANGIGRHIKFAVTGRWPSNLIHDSSDEVIELMDSAARFFYTAKASSSDRNEGCEELEEKTQQVYHDYAGTPEHSPKQNIKARNHHPTVKPTDLMRYLCRLVTPVNGVILDPFMGSGSTGKAAILERFKFIGIEREAEYIEIARCRLKKSLSQGQFDLG